MIGACIHNGDIVVVRMGEEFAVKRLLLYKHKIYLKPENPNYRTVEVTNRTDFEIWDVVTHVVYALVGVSSSQIDPR